VPDSSWFTNRIVGPGLALEDVVRGPAEGPPPDPQQWVVVREKTAGFAPGFVAKDARGEAWFVSFDPPGHAEGATAALVVASKLFWALGYNQVETFITTVDPRRIAIDPDTTMRRPNGRSTPMTREDLDEIFARAARNADGTYRAAAGRQLPGRVLGPFRYEGTRSDDPNDVIDHEHRRELRALRVFGAWTNLTDLKAGNTLDTLVGVNGRAVVRHYLQDVGSTFGMGANGAHDWDEGFEYLYDGRLSRRRLASLGLALSPWQTARYVEYPSVGRFESEAFDPVTWRPRTPPAAYVEMLAEDAFWAARRVAAFDDALIRAVVDTGGLSDARAKAHLATILMQRRDKIARAYLPAVNPIVNPQLGVDGTLVFENAAAVEHVARAPAGYHAAWWRFDNETGTTRTLGETRSATTVLPAPGALPRASDDMVQIDVRAEGGEHAAWHRSVRLHFRRTSGGWTLVGLDRTGGAERPE
jgi:hypothetical protein